MSFVKGDLFTKTRKLVKGLAKPEPLWWLKAMEQSPPATFPRAEGKIEPISLPEDVYVKKAPRFNVSGRYQEQGVTEEDAIGVMEYMTEKKAKKKACSRLKQIAKLQGMRSPSNPFPSAIKEIQAEERKFVRERFSNRDILNIRANEEGKGCI